MLSKKEQEELDCLRAKQLSKTEWLTQKQFDRIQELNKKSINLKPKK